MLKCHIPNVKTKETFFMKRIAPMILVLAMASLACAVGAGGDETVDLENGILFQDDFSDVDSGWDRATSENAVTDYQNDAYHIAISANNYGAWTNPYRAFVDVSVEVDTTLIGGDEDNAFGIICRYADINNFYLGMISSDGYYGFFQRNEGELEFLNMESMQASEAINLGGANNTLRMDCVGNTLSLYVNGQFLGETFDDRLGAGDVGLYAKTFDVSNTDVQFDNIVVSEPGE
jgi:hypothetical protein